MIPFGAIGSAYANACSQILSAGPDKNDDMEDARNTVIAQLNNMAAAVQSGDGYIFIAAMSACTAAVQQWVEAYNTNLDE